MSSNLNLDEAVSCVKNIVDTNRCGICDQTAGERVKYPCGHSSCDDCASKANHDLICSTQPTCEFVSDEPATRRANNAVNLMKSFEAAFKVKVYVYKSQRLSDQLKIEKELFPECIQAPIKYFNKRKSSSFFKDKENKSPKIVFPGVEVSDKSKMEHSYNYVKQWLDSNETKHKQKGIKTPIKRRQPFADLNVNNQSLPQKRILKRADTIMDKFRENAESPAKKKYQSHFQSKESIVGSQSMLDQYSKLGEKENKKQIKKDFHQQGKTSSGEVKKKSDKDESGIELDDEPIVIDDSQTEVIDKDKLAWLAVLEAEKNPHNQTQTSEIKSPEVIKQTENVIKKVPFFKKSSLTETCTLCKRNQHGINNITNKPNNKEAKDISISIENKCFTTLIKVSTAQKKPVYEKNSKQIQTEISAMDGLKNSQKTQSNNELLIEDNELTSKGKELTYSQDVFTAEAKQSEDMLKKEPSQELKEHSQLVIADSDSDGGANESSIIEVTADIHQSKENIEPGVLTELHESEVQRKCNRSGRGRTPHSSDSSDKENYDPNRAKRVRTDKKNLKKRKGYDVRELNFIGTLDA